ncbi:protein SCAF11 isoform X2 [Sebastes umbrosus]|uniref:protein SCAF11 isoform X2 n=1 Tax=Sebastes umbrosus TaxID=72105 RepID=UPI00189DB3F5|nr:protein SCAF11 isoform X2 [Sebastes umbrosus]
MTGAGSGGQGPPDGTDAEEAERCPICLGVLAGGELAMPDSCCHVFCLRCLLTWAELQMAPSCPVDRRPFTNVYRWDGNLSCVQVPVRKRATPPEAESCCCRNPEQKVCLKSKPARRLRRQKAERTADGKTKGLVRKCNDDDPSSLSRKKVRGTECCTWSPSPCVALTTASTQDIAEPVWVAEDIPYDTGFKHCKPQAQDCPWLSPAAPIPANGSSRQNFHPAGWNHSPFPSPFTSSSLFGPGHFVFQGVVCAITCPKGGEKRGGRASTSKAPTKEAKSLPARRSGRNSKSQEEAPAPDPSSPPQSSSPDSDSSTGQPTKPSRASQVPAKRKGKRVTNRKASGKRKAPAKKKKSPEVVSSPAASEGEDEGDGCDKKEDEEDKSDQEQDVNNSKQQQQSDAEGNLNEDQDGFNSADEQGDAKPLRNDVGEDSDETQEQSNEHELKPDEGDGDMSCPSDSAPNSPGSFSGGDRSKREEEEPASPVSLGEKDCEDRTSPTPSDFENRTSPSPSDSEKRTPPSPSDSENRTSPSPSDSEKRTSPSPFDFAKGTSPSPSDSEKRTSPSPSDSDNALLDNLMSPQCDEQADDMDICAESEEANNEESSKEMMAGSCENSPQPSSPSAGDSEDNSAVPESKASEDADMKTAGSEPSLVDSSAEGTKDDGPPKDDGPSKDDGPPKDDSPSMDDTKVVPMDCSSPMSEHGNSPSLELPKESAASAAAEPPGSASQAAKDEGDKDQQESEKSQERKNGKPRRSRFHSPTRTWSPKRDSKPESSRRSRSRERDGSPPSSRSSRARSREKDRDRDGERDHSRRERSRERRRRRSRSRSRSKSRSRSRSRTRTYRRPSPERPSSREQSPPRKERRGGWRSEQGSGTGGEGRRHQGGAGRFENGVPTESSPERQSWSENPDWVTEKTRGDADVKNRDGFSSAFRERGRGGRGERGRGAGRGGDGGGRSFYNQQGETGDSRWPRNNFSGTGNNSGNDAYSRFNENRGGGRRKDSEPGDRSGWSSASSWAVRRSLPADVQDYYSKRERGGSGGWNRQEEEQPGTAAADPPKGDAPPQAVPGNAPVPVMPPQLNVLQHPYPMQGQRGALPVSLQTAAPYAMPPQGPVHLHPAVPLLQGPAVGTQGLPPPPPPPPPMHQGGQTAAAQPDGYATQMASAMGGYGKPGLLPTPTKAGYASATHGQSAFSQLLPSSTTQPGQHNRAQPDSSKKEKKQQIQERAVNEVKNAIKPYYQKNEITKDEYKEIVRKAVEKVCHSKSGEVNSSKVANLVKAYVDKYKHARKK